MRPACVPQVVRVTTKATTSRAQAMATAEQDTWNGAMLTVHARLTPGGDGDGGGGRGEGGRGDGGTCPVDPEVRPCNACRPARVCCVVCVCVCVYIYIYVFVCVCVFSMVAKVEHSGGSGGSNGGSGIGVRCVPERGGGGEKERKNFQVTQGLAQCGVR